MKIANVLLHWSKSVSSDVSKQVLTLTLNGSTTVTEVPAGVEQFAVQISASTPFSFKVDTHDIEGLVTSSEVYSNSIGDLVAPQPATNLFHEVVSVVDSE